MEHLQFSDMLKCTSGNAGAGKNATTDVAASLSEVRQVRDALGARILAALATHNAD